MNVYQKLQTARLKLQSADLKKSGHNKFAGYYYFELGDFLPETQKIFNELGLCGKVSYTADLATLTIINTEKPEDQTEITSPMGSAALKGCHEVQNIGAVETYQRRYLWVTAMEIVEHDALDATTGDKEPAKATVKALAHKSVPKEVFDGLTEEVQNDLRNIAMDVVAYTAKGAFDDAYDFIESKELDSEMKTGLWALFDSKVRSGLKAVGENRRKAA